MANGPAWYFGSSIGEAQGAKRAAEQQYINLSLANRNFDQEQQARIDRIAAAQYEAGRQNYMTGLAQAQQRRANALQAARIRAVAGQREERDVSRIFQQDRQHKAALDNRKAIQDRFDTGQQNQTLRAIEAAKAAEGVRQQARAARDEQAFFANLAKDSNIRNRADLSAAVANLNVGPERMDMLERSLAGRQRKAQDLRETADARALEWNRFATDWIAKGKSFSDVVAALKDNPQDSYLVEVDPIHNRFVPSRNAAYKFGNDALDYFDRPTSKPFSVPPMLARPPVTPAVPPPTTFFPPADDSLDEPVEEDLDDPDGLFR